jgi:hypothetical protein
MILNPLTMKQVDLNRIDQLFIYNPNSGEVLHRYTGRPLMTRDTSGGLLARVYGRTYSAHKIAWFLSHGEWPTFNLRHVDGNRSNNRIENLEPVSLRRANPR